MGKWYFVQFWSCLWDTLVRCHWAHQLDIHAWGSKETSELKIKLGVLGMWIISEALRMDEVDWGQEKPELWGNPPVEKELANTGWEREVRGKQSEEYGRITEA